MPFLTKVTWEGSPRLCGLSGVEMARRWGRGCCRRLLLLLLRLLLTRAGRRLWRRGVLLGGGGVGAQPQPRPVPQPGESVLLDGGGDSC
jgi:hypothetical protein